MAHVDELDKKVTLLKSTCHKPEQDKASVEEALRVIHLERAPYKVSWGRRT